MAVDMFLELEGIKGEAQDGKHKDKIDVLAWSWGMSQSGSTHAGSGSEPLRVSRRQFGLGHAALDRVCLCS
jgi:type VI secretion system secreted protein Hcp